MKFLKLIVILLLTAIPLLCFAAGSYLPGTVTVYNGCSGPGSVCVAGAYNVRYNPAVSTGQISVTVNPATSIEIYAVDSTTGAQFTCYYTPNPPNDPNLYYEYEYTLAPIAAGGNGAQIMASRISATNSTCSVIDLQSASNQMD